MCFAPQRRALFRHGNFQKWSENGVFGTFWLGNVVRATTAYTFSTSQLPKVVWDRVFCTFWLGHVLRATTACNFSSLIWPAGSAPAALARLLFGPPEPQIIWKKQSESRLPYLSVHLHLLSSDFLHLLSSHFLTCPGWLFPPLLFHLCILSEVWLLNFLRLEHVGLVFASMLDEKDTRDNHHKLVYQ